MPKDEARELLIHMHICASTQNLHAVSFIEPRLKTKVALVDSTDLVTEDRQADTCSSLASVLTLNGGLTSPGIPPLERILRTPISPSCQGGNLQEVTQIGRELVKF